ncbi:hypothetical protein SAMN05421676_102369 [Salinibacillus kushneri]|uniref:Uncharacterized protein n=1 Tax=Salinibacillus kushneri TaxID=237682 RepID=A0A1I0B7A2_9BACI|nr:hypothetical protein [Salinibacillus kushneri]SET02658.1 hypothetical protein SAMN05421676_102369 [Salinibacillus kushneri]
MNPVKINAQDVQANLANKIANLELQLANEIAAKQSVVKYAEELEDIIEKHNINEKPKSAQEKTSAK